MSWIPEMTLADQLLELDAVRQLLRLRHRSGGFCQGSGGSPNGVATNLALRALQICRRKNRLLEGDRTYLPHRQEIDAAIETAQQYVRDETANAGPEVVAPELFALITLINIAAGDDRMDIDVSPEHVASSLHLADLDDLPVTVTFLAAALSVLQHGRQRKGVLSSFFAKTNSWGAMIERHRKAKRRPVEYLVHYLLELQGRDGKVYESEFLTQLLVIALGEFLRGECPAELVNLCDDAIDRARYALQQGRQTIPQLQRKYRILFEAQYQGAPQIEINRKLGAIRHDICLAKLEELYPDDRYEVVAERTLRRPLQTLPPRRESKNKPGSQMLHLLRQQRR